MHCASEKRPTEPLFPRTEWEQHPNYPDQVLLLGSHDNFRRLSRYLVETAQAHPDNWRITCAIWFSRWQAAMGGHEHYEESKLYPYLARRYGMALETLVGDHRAMHELADGVRRSLLEDEPAAAHEMLRTYDDALVAHLRREEDLVIPMLLELPRDEFITYTSRSLKTLMANCAC